MLFRYRSMLWVPIKPLPTSPPAIHEFTGFPRGRVVLTGPHRGYQGVCGAVIHQITDLTPAWCIEHRGLPVTEPARTLLDVASVVSYAHLEVAAEDAIVAKVVSL